MAFPRIPVLGDITNKSSDSLAITIANKNTEPAKTERGIIGNETTEERVEKGPPKYVFEIQLNCGGCQKGVAKKLKQKQEVAKKAFEFDVTLDKENGSTVSFWGAIEKDEADAILKETGKEYKFVEPQKKGCCGGGCCSPKKKEL